MSVKLRAPLPSLQTTILLPNPQLADVESPRHEIDIFRAIDGTRRTSVKTTTRRLLTYDFILNRAKAEELKAFIQSYYLSKIRMINHKNQTWDGWVTNNPISFSPSGKESVSVQLQFEGSKVV